MDDKEPKQQGGLSLQTLLISSAAAVAAAIVIPLFWEKGTLIATAMTPIIVALVSEALRRPATAISSAAPRVTRRTGTGAALRAPRREDAAGARGEGPERFDPLPPEERVAAPRGREDDPFGLHTPPPRLRPGRHHWRLAAVTGVAAFVIAAVVLTSTELVLGGSATREGGRTTLFSGSERDRDRDREAPDATAAPDGAEEETAPPAQATPEPEATPEVTPAPTTTPAAPEAAPTAPAPTATP